MEDNLTQKEAVSFVKTDSLNPDFIALVKQLDALIAIRDGDDHSFYDQFNKIDKIKHVIVGYMGIVPVACGSIKKYDEKTMEVKRMFVHGDCRGQGVASQVLKQLEDWAKEMNFEKCILETGKKYPEAINLYTKMGYVQIANYDQYIGVEDSVCFEKKI